MRPVAAAALLLLTAAPAAALAQTAPAPAAPATAVHYTVEETDIGTLLDDPAAKAVLDKHVAGFSANEQIDMARSMTLKGIQQYAPDKLTDKVLSDIQVDLDKLTPAPKK